MDAPPRRSPTILSNDPLIYRQLVAELGRPGVVGRIEGGQYVEAGIHRTA